MRKVSKKSVAGINDMIHRSFKPEKCKTSLKLAISRIRLMRNRRGQQVIQLKKEVAQLLEKGQDQTARIRVEHVIREEKLMSAYDLIEVYCEIIVARLQIIESQKNCPIDLKEAISCVIFASPRCDDIQELKDVQKHFVAKYGKEFVASVLELRPNCGVTSILVDKLSAKAPDVETKVKVLTSIAKEHDMKWEPKSFEEPLQKVDEPFLKGPTSFKSTSAFITEPAKTDFVSQSIQKHEAVKNTSIDEGTNSTTISGADFMTKLQGPTSFESSSILARESISQKHLDVEKPSADILTKTDEKAGSFSIKTNIASEQSWPEQKSPEREQGPEQPARSYSRDDVNWSLDFKDAASAAKAAAESAERASIAARAAAVLASRESDPGRYLNGSHGLDHNLGDENLLKFQKLESEASVQEEVHISSIRAKNVYMANPRDEGQRMDDLQIKPEKRSSDSGSHVNKTSRTLSSTHDLGSHVNTSIGNIQVESTVRRQKEMRKNDSDGEEITKDSLFGHLPSSSKASYDGKGFVLDHASLNSSRQCSFEADSHPCFDDDSVCSDDHIEIGDSTYVTEASLSQSKGSKFSDSSSYVEPWSRKHTSGPVIEGRSSLQVHSVKESDADESARTRVDNPSPNYDTEPEDEDTKSFLVLDGRNHLGPTASTGIFSSGQTEKKSKHSETLDHSYHESSQVLVLENLTGGLRNKGFPPAPYLRSEESPYSRKSTRVPDNISNDEVFNRTFNIQDSHEEMDMRRPRKPSSNSDTSEEENSQLYESPRISKKERIDTAVYRTGPRRSYQKSDAEDSEESTMTSTLVKSVLSRRGRRGSTSLVPQEDVHASNLTIGGSSLSTQHRKARSESSKQEVSYHEPRMTEYKESGPRKSYQKSDAKDSKELIMTSTLVKSESSRRGRRASTLLVPEEDAYDSDLITGGPSLSTQHRKTSSEPYKQEVSYHEPCTTEYKESGPIASRLSFSTKSDDIDKSESHQSFAESHISSGGSGIAAQKHSRRTRPTPKDHKSPRSKASDQRDSQDIVYMQSKFSEPTRCFPESHELATQDDRLERKGSPKFLSPKSKTERSPVTRPGTKDLERTGGASSEIKEIRKASGFMSSTSSSPKPASKFAPPKNLARKTDSGSSESSGENSDEEHQPKSPIPSSSEISRTLESKPSQKNPPKTESSEGKKSPKPPASTSGEESKTGVASTPTQNDLVRTSSETSKNPKPLTHPKLPDSDAFTAYFKSLRSNTKK